MVEIRNYQDLERWFEGKSSTTLQVITMRIALRVLPIANERGKDFDLVAVSIRALFISWVASVFSPNGIEVSLVNAREVAISARIKADAFAKRTSNTRHDADSASGAAAYTADVTVSSLTAGFNAADLRNLSLAVGLANALSNSNARSTIWNAVTADANILGDDSASILTTIPLWPNKKSPEFTRLAWTKLIAERLKDDEHISVWIDWYERRLRGEQFGWDVDPAQHEALCVGLALEANKFWNRPFAEVNADITARVEAARHKPPAAGTRQPASVKPFWRDGILAQDYDIASSARQATLEGMLAAVGDDFEMLANEMKGLANISDAALAMLTTTAEHISVARIDRNKIFRLANRLLALQKYSLTVVEEWTSENGAHYHAAVLQLQNVLATYPEIREFLDAVPKPERSVDEVRAIEAADDVIIEAMASEEGRAIIDISLIAAAQDSHQAVIDDMVPWVEDLAASRRRSLGSVENLLAGLNNIVGDLGNRAVKSLHKEAQDQADKSGEHARKLLVFLYKQLTKAGTAATAGTAVGTGVAVTHMEILAQASQPLGIAIALMTYVVLNCVPQKK